MSQKKHTFQLDHPIDIIASILLKPLHSVTLRNQPFFYNIIFIYFQSQKLLTSWTLKTISFEGVEREASRNLDNLYVGNNL